MDENKESIYQIINAANKAGATPNKWIFQELIKSNNLITKKHSPKSSDKDCDDLNEILPTLPEGTNTNFPKSKLK